MTIGEVIQKLNKLPMSTQTDISEVSIEFDTDIVWIRVETEYNRYAQALLVLPIQDIANT